MLTSRFRMGLVLVALLAAMPTAPLRAQLPPEMAQGEKPDQKQGEKAYTKKVPPDTDNHPMHPLHEIDDAMIRLPLAALFGAALALRPRRKGTPKRDPAVIQTQIVLSVVGAVIMLVVGASLARAF